MIKLFNEKKDCCGCGACQNTCPQKAIAMAADQEGFLYPEINDSMCTECNLCKEVCPFNENYDISNNLPEPYIFAVKHKDDNIRMTSASGGMFTSISDYILENNGIVYGAAFNETFKVCHQRAVRKDHREKFKGSKYVQSDLTDVYNGIKQDLLDDKKVLFTGTPCQTAGLHSFLKDTDRSNLYLCDLICHGAPSPLIWKEYLSFLENKYKESIKEVYFRDKEFAGNLWGMKIVFNSQIYKNDYFADYYFYLYFSEYILRESCHNCKFTNMHRPSDITMGDFWGIENHKPEFYDEKGVSLVLINSEKGRYLFDKISDKIDFVPSNRQECLPRQPQLRYPSEENIKRGRFWKDYHNKGFKYALKKYTPFGICFKIRGYVENYAYKILKKLKLINIIKKVLNRLKHHR